MTGLRCDVCDAVRMELGGHPNSQLDGDDGLAAATMREVHRLQGRLTADMLKDALPGYLKIEEDAAPEFWAEYADNIRNRLRATADAPEGPFWVKKYLGPPDTHCVMRSPEEAVRFTGFESECIAVRDTLNRLSAKGGEVIG